MKNQSFDVSISLFSHPDIIKRFNISRLLIYVTLFIVGLIVFFSAFEIYTQMPLFSYIIGGFGLFLIGLSIARFLKKSKEMIYLPTRSITKKQSLFFDFKYLEDLKNFVSTGQLSDIYCLKPDMNGNVRLDILESTDHKFVALQLYRFVPYTYSPVTEIYCYTDQDAAKVCSLISENK